MCSRLIQQGATEGHWIFLANCHLLRSWMPELGRTVDTLQSSEVNERFRSALTNMTSNSAVTSLCSRH